jgi:HEAT repeat protein
MRLLLGLFLLTLLTGCTFSQSQPPTTSHTPYDLKLPEFVDDPVYGLNEDIAAARQKLIFYRNFDAMEEILKHDSALVRHEMQNRLSPDHPMSLRFIAAAVLVLKDDRLGKQFFIDQSKQPQDLGDLYVTLNHLAWSAETLTSSKADLSWAEDLMIEALQNRTRVNRQNALHFPANISWQDPELEIRELAVDYGEFADHLARMRSQKGLPVILSLLREYPFYRLNTSIGYLGRYKDERVESLLLEFLNRHERPENKDTYRFAVGAASEMGLKAAVPILLRHLDDENSYPGLRDLADASVIPTIKAALPRLKSYARAEAELTLIHLQGGDVVPLLLRLLKRKDFLKRNDVIMWLEKVPDPRSVATISSALCHDPEGFVRWGSIRALAAVKNKEAIQGLVDGLGCDYSKPDRLKTSPDHDFNREYREEIAKALQLVTGESFGTDQKRWLLWLDQRRTF